MNVCFFSSEGLLNIYRQQYSIQDINILTELNYNLSVASKFSEMPINVDLYFSWWASGSIISLIKAKIFGKPIIVIAGGNEVMLYKDSISNTPRGYLATPLYKKIATQIVLRYADNLIVVSELMVDDVFKLCGRRPSVIHNSVNVDLYKYDNSKEREYILSVMNLESNSFELKRGEVFLKSIPQILEKFPNQKFIIIGRWGDMYRLCLDIINDLGINDNVRLINSVENTEMPSFYNSSKIYVQISDTETFGLSVAEAMSCETPVIVSKRGFLPDLVGNEGIYVNHNSSDSLADTIIRYLNKNDNELREIGKKLRKRIVSKFSYKIRKEKIKRLINETLMNEN